MLSAPVALPDLTLRQAVKLKEHELGIDLAKDRCGRRGKRRQVARSSKNGRHHRDLGLLPDLRRDREDALDGGAGRRRAHLRIEWEHDETANAGRMKRLDRRRDRGFAVTIASSTCTSPRSVTRTFLEEVLAVGEERRAALVQIFAVGFGGAGAGETAG